jgi:flagellar biosynthesis regulator FlbT
MKTEALHTLITARVLFDSAHRLCTVDDKHAASAGLVILQDAVELIFYACLIEKESDEKGALERLSFDQLIGELNKTKVRVKKSGTLKAMNKQRVIVKHYGQLAEPTIVRHYFDVTQAVVDDLLQQVFGGTLYGILLYDMIKDGEVREYLATAEKLIDARKFFDALIEIRKAIFLEVERDYSIAGWKDVPRGSMDVVMGLTKGGLKAPHWCRNKEWIDENVKNPFDYIQLDHECMRNDLLEWGVSTQDYWNLWRLTPSVFRESKDSEWLIKRDIQRRLYAPTEQNARYCLDRAFSLILKKREHLDLIRQLSYEGINSFMVRLKCDQPLYEKASTSSTVVGTLQKGKAYSVNGFVPGLSDAAEFASIFHFEREEPKAVYFGYIAYDAATCELIDVEENPQSK